MQRGMCLLPVASTAESESGGTSRTRKGGRLQVPATLLLQRSSISSGTSQLTWRNTFVSGDPQDCTPSIFSRTGRVYTQAFEKCWTSPTLSSCLCMFATASCKLKVLAETGARLMALTEPDGGVRLSQRDVRSDVWWREDFAI